MNRSDIEALESRLIRINHHRRLGGLDKGAQLLERAVDEKFRCTERLAVYGSLAPGRENFHVISHLKGDWKKAVVFGDLFDRGWGAGLGFPAMRWRPNGRPLEVDVLGSSGLPDTWADLDQFEGSGYLRILVPYYVGDDLEGVTNIYELASEDTAAEAGEIVLATARFYLRRMSFEDIDYLAALMADSEVTRYFPAPLTRDDSEAWIDRQLGRYRRDGCGFWLVVERSSLQPVGQVGVLMTEVGGAVEPALGYVIDRQFWRRRVASETAAACIEWVFAETEYPRVITLIRPENRASQAVARKIGMVSQGQARFKGLDHLVFAIDRPGRERDSRV
jgi:RimJ/RimL family protein N-acetyltransferase